MTTVIRVSSLADYPDCPRRSAARMFRDELTAAGFRLRYTLRAIGSLVGTAVHHGAAMMLREKATTGRLPPETVAQDAARDNLVDQLQAGEVQFDPPSGVTFTRNNAIGQAARMTLAYQLNIAPQVEPVNIETRLEAEVEPGLILSGQSDLVAREPHSIRDTKTGRLMPASFAPQLGGYSLLARSHGSNIDEAAIDFIQRVRAKARQPAPVTQRAVVAHAETAATAILKRMAQDIETFRNGDPKRNIRPGDPWSFIANPSSRLCSSKYCPAHGTEFCHEGKREGPQDD